MSNLVIRKSKHVIINEDHDARRLKTQEETYDDAQCVKFNETIGAGNVATPKNGDDQDDLLLWKAPERRNDADADVDATIQNSQLLKTVDRSIKVRAVETLSLFVYLLSLFFLFSIIDGALRLRQFRQPRNEQVHT